MDNSLLNFESQNYVDVDNVEVIFDKDNNPVDKENVVVTPIQVIKNMAKMLGQTVNDPKPNCKWCNGRGYIGRDSKSQAPIPCQCIYPKDIKGDNEYIYNKTKRMSRDERRRWERELRKSLKHKVKE